YSCYNIFRSNNIVDTEFGIKINASGNAVDGNTFSNVPYPILLHCVWYSLTETDIRNQSGDRVAYWFKNSDYNGNPTYLSWFPYQDDRNNNISTSDRFMHIRPVYAHPFGRHTGLRQLQRKRNAPS